MNITYQKIEATIVEILRNPVIFEDYKHRSMLKKPKYREIELVEERGY